MEKRIDIAVNFMSAQAIKNARRFKMSLENIVNGGNARFAAMSNNLNKITTHLTMATRASKIFQNQVNAENKAAVASMFPTPRITAFEQLRNSAIKTTKSIELLKNATKSMPIIKTLSPTGSITNLVNKSAMLSQGKSVNDMISKSIRLYDKEAAKIHKVGSALQTTNKKMGRFVGWLKQGQDGMIGFNGAALSTMFFGMQLQKTFGGALKTIFDGYRKIIPESSKFNQATNKLSANWEFFKFQLADAMASSPFFQTMIGFVIKLIQHLQDLPKPFKLALVAAIALFAALGTYLFASGVIRLGIGGLIDDFGKVGKAIDLTTVNSNTLKTSLAGIKSKTIDVKLNTISSGNAPDFATFKGGNLVVSTEKITSKISSKIKGIMAGLALSFPSLTKFIKKILPKALSKLFNNKLVKGVGGKILFWIEAIVDLFTAWEEVSQKKWDNQTAKWFAILTKTTIKIAASVAKFVNMIIFGVVDFLTQVLSDVLTAIGFDKDNKFIKFLRTNFSEKIYKGINAAQNLAEKQVVAAFHGDIQKLGKRDILRNDYFSGSLKGQGTTPIVNNYNITVDSSTFQNDTTTNELGLHFKKFITDLGLGNSSTNLNPTN